MIFMLLIVLVMNHAFDFIKVNNTHYFLIGVGGNSFIGPTGFCQVDVTSTESPTAMLPSLVTRANRPRRGIMQSPT